MDTTREPLSIQPLRPLFIFPFLFHPRVIKNAKCNINNRVNRAHASAHECFFELQCPNTLDPLLQFHFSPMSSKINIFSPHTILLTITYIPSENTTLFYEKRNNDFPHILHHNLLKFQKDSNLFLTFIIHFNLNKKITIASGNIE